MRSWLESIPLGWTVTLPFENFHVMLIFENCHINIWKFTHFYLETVTSRFYKEQLRICYNFGWTIKNFTTITKICGIYCLSTRNPLHFNFFLWNIIYIFNEGINLGARIVLLFTLLFSIYHRFKDIMWSVIIYIFSSSFLYINIK